MLRLILTHPGGAHKDDLLAVCVLIAKYGAPVVRRVPTDEELVDPAVAIVDIGGVHDPEKMDFDHHHFPREHAPTCALSLVLQHLGIYEDALKFCDWLEVAEWFDSRGPKKTAEWLGVPRRAVSQLNSPIDVTLLRRFAANSELKPGDTLYEYMRFVGEDLLEYLRVVRERLDFTASVVQRWTIQQGDDTIEAVFLPRTDPIVDEPSTAVANYIRAEGLEEVVAATVYPDRRGSGYGIGRYEDHPMLDFSRVGEEPDVHFAHNSGFVCKTSATEPERLRELIAGAWGQAKG
ncbi:MAG: MYG1 family protein [Myxococcota bacterium]